MRTIPISRISNHVYGLKLLTCCLLLLTFTQSTAQENFITTVILVRHAEKEAGENKDPELTEQGKARALRLADMLQRTSRGWSDGEPERLTPRQRQVLEAMIQGCETREMAQRFHISVETVRSHIKAVLAKLNAHNRLDAGLIALRLGLVRWDQPS